MPTGGLERLPFASFFRKEKGPSPEQELFERTLRAYRAWNVRERGGIIDFDLTAGPDDFEEVTRGFSHEATPEDRSFMVSFLGRLLERIDETLPGSKENQHHLEFIRARAEASLWFAMRLRGEEMDSLVYLEKTNGVRIEPAAEKTLLIPLRNKLFAMAKQNGIPIQKPETYLAWRKEKQQDPNTTRELVAKAIDKSLASISEFIDEPCQFEYEVNAVDEEKYYYAWSRTNYQTQVFTLDLNFNETKIWTPGKAEELGVHEGGEHLRRMHDWRQQIRRGKMPAVIGQTVVHGREAVVEEGLALTIAHLVPKIYQDLSAEGQFQVDASILRHMVYGNVSIMLNRSPKRPPIKRATQYIHKFIPWEPQSEIDLQIEWRTKDPTYQAYLPAYAFGARMFLEIIENLNERGRKQLLKDLSLKPYTPEQLMYRVAELKNGKKNRNESQTSVTSPSDIQALA